MSEVITGVYIPEQTLGIPEAIRPPRPSIIDRTLSHVPLVDLPLGVAAGGALLVVGIKNVLGRDRTRWFPPKNARAS